MHLKEDFPTLIENIQPGTKKRKACGSIKANFQNKIPDFLDKVQLIAVPRLESSSGSRQAQAVWNVIVDWYLEDKVQFFVVMLRLQKHFISMLPACFLTKSLIEVCLFLRQAKSFVHELVLKNAFEVKISQATTNPDIPLFKKFRDNWKSDDPDKIQYYKESLALHRTISEIDNLLELYGTELTKEIARDDFRELIELSVICLGGDTQREFKI
ncbi:hypothetical protein J437_LFUL003318 [Ladona fulva]|uniref:Uncharacterized protein n=1 Tax=Ladona fulva TaxID=123851 RepID=A0A8K0P6B4_LADFU|nr:hypothetical protein J437_LFUL003318 [Ladona fulva]